MGDGSHKATVLKVEEDGRVEGSDGRGDHDYGRKRRGQEHEEMRPSKFNNDRKIEHDIDSARKSWRVLHPEMRPSQGNDDRKIDQDRGSPRKLRRDRSPEMRPTRSKHDRMMNDYASREYHHRSRHFSCLREENSRRNDNCFSRDSSMMFRELFGGREENRRRNNDYLSRDGYYWARQVSGRREDNSHRNDEKAASRKHLALSLQINQKGEPQGDCESVVSKHLTSVVRKYVPVQLVWSAVTSEVKYKICQDLQGLFRDGGKLDSSWIKM